MWGLSPEKLSSPRERVCVREIEKERERGRVCDVCDKVREQERVREKEGESQSIGAPPASLSNFMLF